MPWVHCVAHWGQLYPAARRFSSDFAHARYRRFTATEVEENKTHQTKNIVFAGVRTPELPSTGGTFVLEFAHRAQWWVRLIKTLKRRFFVLFFFFQVDWGGKKKKKRKKNA